MEGGEGQDMMLKMEQGLKTTQMKYMKLKNIGA